MNELIEDLSYSGIVSKIQGDTQTAIDMLDVIAQNWVENGKELAKALEIVRTCESRKKEYLSAVNKVFQHLGFFRSPVVVRDCIITFSDEGITISPAVLISREITASGVVEKKDEPFDY